MEPDSWCSDIPDIWYSYSNLADASEACLEDQSCQMVYLAECNDTSRAQLCNGSSGYSEMGSCVYKKGNI